MLGRVLGLEPLRDLRQARMARDERRRPGRRGLGGHHPERLREDRGHDDGVREREQVDEVPVLQGAREQRPRRRGRLELRPVVAEADDHGAGVEALERLEEDVDALVVEELAEVDDRRLVAGEERRERARRCPRRAAAPPRSPGSAGPRAPRRGGRRAPRPAAAAGTRPRRRPAAPRDTCSTSPTISSSTRRMCAEPTKVASAARSDSLPHAASSGRPRIAYSSSEPWALTASRRAGGCGRTGPPISTWFAKRRSGSPSDRSAAAFAST